MTCTVIVVAKNAAPYVLPALHSVEYFANEIILIDNFSTDGTYDVMSAFNQYTPQARLYQLDGSVAELRNYGLSLATKEFVVFLDADDYLFPEVVQSHLRQIQQRNADVLFSPYIKLNYKLDPPDVVLKTVASDPLSLPGGTTNCTTSFVIWRREIIKEVEWTDLLHSDQQFVLDVLTHNVIQGRKVIGTVATCPSGYYRSGWSEEQISRASINDHVLADRRIMEHYTKDVRWRDAFSYR